MKKIGKDERQEGRPILKWSIEFLFFYLSSQAVKESAPFPRLRLARLWISSSGMSGYIKLIPKGYGHQGSGKDRHSNRET